MSILDVPLETKISLNGSRLYSHFRSLCITMDSFTLASSFLNAVTNKELNSLSNQSDVKFKEGMWATLRGRSIKLVLAIPLISVFKATLHEQPEEPLWYALAKDDGKPGGGRPGSPFTGLKGMFNDSAAARYILFYEYYWPFVWKKANSNRDSIHPIWAFARVVRNALGHGGLITIDDKSFRPVSWHGLTYGPAQHGTEIIGSDMEVPDLYYLMIEMDQALTEMSCPD
jgi:hypothetical protein